MISLGRETALALGVLLFCGFFGGRLARKVRIPAVAGYVMAGVLLGPSFLKLIPDSLNQSLSYVKDLGLGMVAMLIGSELVWKKIKKLGKNIIIISIVEAVITFILVFSAIRHFLHQPFVVSALLASLATVTTPVATMAVIREYRAKGPFTSTLLGVIAVDDIWCITAVGISVGLVLSMGAETNALQFAYLVPPVLEVIFSIVMGIVIGFLAILVLRKASEDLEILALFLGLIFLNAGLAKSWDLSALLMTMAGAGLHIDILIANWNIAAVYIVFRIVGKVGGCYLGAQISNAEEKVKRYLGTAMLTKAGLSLGLLIYMQERLRGVELGALLVSVELAAITFFEITGPIFVRYSLFKVGEARIPGSGEQAKKNYKEDSMMTVKNCMKANVITVDANTKIADVLEVMFKKKISGLPVVNEENSIVGIVSKSDIFGESDYDRVKSKPVAEIMSKDIRTVGPEDLIEPAVNYMVEHSINRLPVVNAGKVVGIIARSDVIDYYSGVKEKRG